MKILTIANAVDRRNWWRCMRAVRFMVTLLGEKLLSQDFADGGFPSAPGVDTICVFPKNIARLVKGGEEAELLVGLKNDGQSSLNVVAIKASVHLPFDRQLLVQNLAVQVFNNGSVPSSAQDSFPYIFSVSKFLQPGPFDLVGTIVYEMDQHPYQNTFYNGTIEVVSLVFYSAWNLLFFLLLELHFLSYLGYGLMVKYRTLRNQNSSICRKNNRDSNNIL
ncbi:hypothetical protein KIW84_023011 [Lathyrus oleraceus]|uniref:Translocon-associated protein subunit alpha n=2 Tax=Pisum sativum TaxID=3888 RepID=A0A9D5BBD2_PEA|nr:hypothetical protein KIW84_023011 [Pisum sativum]